MGSDSDKPKRWKATLKFVAGLMLACSLPTLFIVWQIPRDNLVFQAERVIDLPGINWYGWSNDNVLPLPE